MAIPDFQTLMRPLLEHLADREVHSNKDTLEQLADRFELTEDERADLLPSGQQPVFVNRVAWAKTHLKGAGLIESPARARYRITADGLKALEERDLRIDLRYLKRFASYRRFREPNIDHQQSGSREETEDVAAESMTPFEQVEQGYQRVRTALEGELLDKVLAGSPVFFERLVVELLVAMGYGGSRRSAGQTLGQSGDGGVDGVIKEDRLGLDAIYIQAKRWANTVGRPEIQKFAGALQGLRVRKGVFITTSDFSREARAYAAAIDTRIILVNGAELTGYMVDFGIGVTRVALYELSDVNHDYFES